ncbi:hypothetical protein ACQKL0_06195 [Peribacillus sp. NPDC097264]|uniref:hypothetical protein n=1 Tax=Peribacillus sp. NPDC097264 TaxID=3390616 RepID=UPI003D033623
MKWNNEEGYTLLSVLLSFLILTTLGMVLLAASINGAKRTEIRETEIVEDIDDISAVKEGVSIIEEHVNTMETPLLSGSKSEYNNDLATFINEENLKGIFTIEDLTKNYPTIDNQHDNTRVFEVSSGKYHQKVYITAMPSFLKYALGAGKDLTINGSPYIDGNIYAKEQFNISNQALYMFKSSLLSRKTDLPAVEDYSELHANRQGMNICISAPSCYGGAGHDKEELRWQRLNVPTLKDAFLSGNILFNDVDDTFNEIDIKETFIDKLSSSSIGISGLDIDMSIEDLNQSINQKDYPKNEKVRFDDLTEYGTISPIIHSGDAYIDSFDIELGDKQWLVISGNATIENSLLESMDVKGNILITGDLTIKGKVSFDSVIYVLGSTTLNNADIPCYKNKCGDQPDDSSLILMTQGKLSIARINKFQNETNTINGYFYTESKSSCEYRFASGCDSKEVSNIEDPTSSEIFAVGSILNINGGVFSKSYLTVNSYRGDVEDDKGDGDLSFPAVKEDAESRLTIKNNKRLFLNKTHALPKVEGLDVIPDKLNKDK